VEALTLHEKADKQGHTEALLCSNSLQV